MVGPFRKNYIAALFVSALVLGTAFAGSDEELFLRANKYYEQKDYDNALISYDMMTKKGRAVLYNMGNVCFHKGDYAQALVYWSRAQIGTTLQEYNLIARNKEHVLTLLGKQSDAPLKYRLFQLLNEALPYVSLFFLQLFFLMCWYLLFLLMRANRLKFKKMILGFLCFLIVTSGVGLGVHYSNQCAQNGVVVKRESQLFAAPDKGFHALCPVVYADNVTIKEMREGWYKVGYADMIGWVEADVVQII
jgi:hypothetical protein